jgi:DNA excision repair protein ERCC-5
MKKDKVIEAMASNPRLAEMFQDFVGDDDDDMEYDEEFDDIDLEDIKIPGSTKENSSLSSKWDKEDEQEGFIEDVGSYIDNDPDAMDRVIAQIYQDDINNQEDEKSSLFMKNTQHKPERDPAFDLDPDDFFQLWKSRAPDAFVYLYSLNNEHEKIIHDAIYELSISELEKSLQSIRKKHGKKSSTDELGLEATEFHQRFLESVIEWRRIRAAYEYVDQDSDELAAASTLVTMMTETPDTIQSTLNSNSDPFLLGFKDPEALETDSKDAYMMLSDNDSDQGEIHFVQQDTSVRTKENQTFTQPSLSSAKINAQQSTLNKNKMEHSTTDRAEKLIKSTEANITEGPSSVDSLEAQENKGTEEMMEEKDEKGEDIEEEKDEMDEQVNKILEEESYEDIIKQNSENISEPVVIQEHGYNSEEEMEDIIQEEESEYVRFVSDLASKDLDDVQRELDNELKGLNAQQRKQKANTVEVTNEMVEEIQVRVFKTYKECFWGLNLHVRNS